MHINQLVVLSTFLKSVHSELKNYLDPIPSDLFDSISDMAFQSIVQGKKALIPCSNYAEYSKHDFIPDLVIKKGSVVLISDAILSHSIPRSFVYKEISLENDIHISFVELRHPFKVEGNLENFDYAIGIYADKEENTYFHVCSKLSNLLPLPMSE